MKTATTGGTTNTNGGKPAAAGGPAYHHLFSSTSSVTSSLAGEKNRGNKKLPLRILNFPHNLPVHLSEIDLMIESDGVSRSTPIDALPTFSTTNATTPTATTIDAESAGVHGPRLTTNGPVTPVLATTTATTTNYSDETGTGHDSANNNIGLDGGGVPWSPHSMRADDETAAINRNGPESVFKGDGLEEASVGHSKRLRDQVNGGNFAETNDENRDEQTSAHQMTKSVSGDVKYNTSGGSAQQEKKKDADDRIEGNENQATTMTTIQTTTRRTAAAESGGAQLPWKEADDVESSAAASAAVAVAAEDEDFIRKISIDDDSPLAKHYIITSSGDIENIPLANQHLVSQFRENFINEIMPLNSVEKAVKVDMPPPTLILDTYPSPAIAVTRAGRGALGTIAAVESTAPIIVGNDQDEDDDDNSALSTIGGSSAGVPTLGTSNSYATKIFIPTGLAPSGPTSMEKQQQTAAKKSLESAQVWKAPGSNYKESAAANANNKPRDPECIVMGKWFPEPSCVK